jgi:isochorismate hydrolase
LTAKKSRTMAKTAIISTGSGDRSLAGCACSASASESRVFVMSSTLEPPVTGESSHEQERLSLVRKTRVGAFSTTDLDRKLRDLGVDTLILAGISTSGVVLSTLRDASDRDYQIVVLTDGCADVDPEVHDVLMRKVFPRQAHIATVAELPALFRQHR